MHPLFGVEQPQHPGSDPMYQQPQTNYGGQQFASMQGQAPPPLNQPAASGFQSPSANFQPAATGFQQSPGGFYNPQQQQQPFVQQQQVNYENFQTFSGQQTQQSMSPPPVREPPKQKLPIPEEFIYMQTVFEELKTQCFNAAGNPVSLRRNF